MAQERVQKLIAQAGLCSRRQAEVLIREGRVRVNGDAAKLGDKADLDHDHVKVDGKLLRGAEAKRYLLIYKPREIMTTCDDPEDRTTVLDLVRPLVSERVFPVGRLDYHSEGLLIMTNDGDLAARITHPRYGLVREYLVKIRGDLDDRVLGRLMQGTVLEGHRVVPLKVVREGATKSGAATWWRIQVTEGRTHEVRELFFRVGHAVQRLRRTAIGPLRDEKLRQGQTRELNASEIRALQAATRKVTSPPRARARRGDDRDRRPRSDRPRSTEASRPKRGTKG